MPDLTPADLELLSAYLDNELAPAERAALERRLAADPALRAELEALRRVAALLHDHLAVPLRPRDFRLDPALYGAAVPSAPRVAGPVRRAYPRWGRLAALAASLAVVFFAGLLVISNLGGRRSPDSAVLEPASAQIALAPTETALLGAVESEETQEDAAEADDASGILAQQAATPTPALPAVDTDVGAEAPAPLDDAVPTVAAFAAETESGGLPTGVPAMPALPLTATPAPTLPAQPTFSPDLSLGMTATVLADALSAEVTQQALLLLTPTPESFAAADAANAAPPAAGIGGAAPPGESAGDGQQRRFTATPKSLPTQAALEEAESASLAEGAAAAAMPTAAAAMTATATVTPAPTGTAIAQAPAAASGRDEAAQSPPAEVVALAVSVALGVAALVLVLVVLRR